MNDRKTILAIDYNNVLFTSYYGEKLVNSNGQNLNAVKSFFNKIRSFKETFEPDYIVFANDLSRSSTFRRKMYPGYKAQRKPMDPDIFNQMKIASKLVGLLGFQFINNPLYEADDILGMIAHWGMDHDMDTVIISSDRDLYQLVSTHTYIMSPRNNDLIDLDYMHDMYQLTPSQWIDLKILQGDQSDNITGVRGIGNKTATQLMLEYGSVDNIYNHLSELKPNVRDNLINGRNDIPTTRTLVTIVTDYSKINLEESMLFRKAPFTVAIYSYLNEIELPSLIIPMKYSLLPQLNDKIEIHDQAQIPSNN